MDNDNVVKVGMAELSALKHPGVLITLGLGSCVGIALYDRVSKVIGYTCNVAVKFINKE